MVDEFTKVLVVAPHADDEAFGCGGTIAKWAKKGAWIHLIVMTVGFEGSRIEDTMSRYNECIEASKILGVSMMQFFYPWKDASLDTISQRRIVADFDTVFEMYHYDYVFFPYPSHHKDHKITQEAVIAALRPGAHITPHNILMYEYTYPSWSNYDVPEGKFYVDISDGIKEKVEAIKCYKSQLRQHPHPVSVDTILAINKVRGMAIQRDYAEMFYVVQMIADY